jgi:RNAse (barnase) inhibitor barstar
VLYAEDLRRTTYECVHFVAVEQIRLDRDLADVRHYPVFETSGAPINSDVELFQSMAAAMHFPAYFGMNWDALGDCLRDMSWAPARGYSLVVSNARSLWANQASLAGTLVEVWLFSAEWWSRANVPFHLVFIW